MKTRKNSRLWIAVVLAAALSLSAFAKKKPEPYALIFATVYNAENRPEAGVPVRIRRADQKKAKWELVSDRRGEAAQRVPAGKADYVIWLAPEGRHLPKQQEVTVHVENDERQDISLHLIEEPPVAKKK
jgi:hypothetical protein